MEIQNATEHEKVEALLPNKDYVVDELSDLQEVPVEFYKLPVTEEEVQTLNKIPTKYCEEGFYRITSLPSFIDSVVKDCLHDSVSDDEVSVFRSVLSKVIEDYNDRLGDSVALESAILSAKHPLEEKYRGRVSYIETTSWHNDIRFAPTSWVDYIGSFFFTSDTPRLTTPDVPRLTADLSFTDAHTEFLKPELTKMLSDSDKCSFTIGQPLNKSEPGCIDMLPQKYNSSDSIKAPKGPYASHFKLSSIHQVPYDISFRGIFLILDTVNKEHAEL